MKNKIPFALVFTFLLGFSLVATYGCKKDEPENESSSSGSGSGSTNQVPSLTTSTIGNISTSSADGGGSITSDGGATITSRGICWSTNPNPTIADNSTSCGSGNGFFTCNMTGLAANTTYYVKAFATNSVGIAYGNQVIFTTTNVTAPCAPNANWVFFNLQNINYNSVIAGTSGLSYGDYGLVGNASNSDLRIEFSQSPVTGIYTTVGSTSFINANECIVNSTFGGTIGYHFVAAAGDLVYVTKNGSGAYSITFCNLLFQSGSTTYTFNTDGNLTSN